MPAVALAKNARNDGKEKKFMVRIRLRRVGGKGQPSYRIVATEKKSQRDGRSLEILGFYNPRTQPATIELERRADLYLDG